jgi:hypothetical protein
MVFDMTKLKETVKYMQCDDSLFFFQAGKKTLNNVLKLTKEGLIFLRQV